MMRKGENTIGFKLVTDVTINEFEKAVTKLLKDGWELQGGVCVVNDHLSSTGRTYAQGMFYFENGKWG